MTERWDVKASDGGAIAVWVDGHGPPLVLVHGAIGDHTGFAPLIGELRGEMTTFAMDRRGFGASPNGSGYCAEREFTDRQASGSAGRRPPRARPRGSTSRATAGGSITGHLMMTAW
jgi:pimeloyl-ACP methyl ester carboxylesterase